MQKKELDGTLDQSTTDTDGTQELSSITGDTGTTDSASTTDTDGTTDSASTTVDKKKSLKDIDPDDLTDEQLVNLDLSEFEVDESAKKPADADADQQADEKGDAETDEIGEDISPDLPSEGGKDIDTDEKGDPLKDTQSALTRSQQENADLKKQLRENRAKLRKAQAGSFEELSENELTDLKYDDPDAYVEYQINKNKHEQSVESDKQSVEQERAESQFDEITGFAKDQGIDVDNKKDLKDFFGSDKFRQLDKFVMNNLKPNADGLFSSDQMSRAYKMLFADELIEKSVADAKLKGSIEAVDNITKLQKNGGGGSDLDRIKKTSTDKPKSASELNQDDIDAMGDAELDQYEKELAVLENG
ncbi:MAG: hypothetical protein H8D67_12740 [Deltaproteobacteria bacterium]|nr:hypothetical protein [Deltaproteobacteria bacterium]